MLFGILNLKSIHFIVLDLLSSFLVRYVLTSLAYNTLRNQLAKLSETYDDKNFTKKNCSNKIMQRVCLQFRYSHKNAHFCSYTLKRNPLQKSTSLFVRWIPYLLCTLNKVLYFSNKFVEHSRKLKINQQTESQAFVICLAAHSVQPSQFQCPFVPLSFLLFL